MIAAYLSQVHVANADSRLTKFGAILSEAAPLRNDSNYEALLIAHEFRHETMSDAFDRLSLHMGRAAESMLPFVLDAFNGFRRYDPGLPENRDAYEAFLHKYVHDRIGGAIRQKLGDSASTIEAELTDILTRLGTRCTGVQFDDLENQVSMAVFGSKAQLMHKFQEGIRNLERAATE